MKIIDAHLHFCPGREYFDGIAVAAGHENTEEHLREEYRRLGIVHGIVMGNRGLDCRNTGIRRSCAIVWGSIRKSLRKVI